MTANAPAVSRVLKAAKHSRSNELTGRVRGWGNTTEGFVSEASYDKTFVKVTYTAGSWCRWSTETRQAEEKKQLDAYTKTLQAKGYTVKRTANVGAVWGEHLEVTK